MPREPTEMELRVRDALIDSYTPDPGEEDMLRSAQAAIRAMREPTERMRAAICVGAIPKCDNIVVGAYKQMIDAASPEEPV